VKIEPNVAEHRNNLGAAYHKAKRYEESLPHFSKASELDPHMWLALDNLGGALAILGRWAEAISAYERALKINPLALDVYGHLADAYARSNQAAKATATVEKAREIANARGMTKLANKMTLQLEAFQSSLEKKRSETPNAATSTLENK
jgi:tetratricopeptide (TPR) repeat protein